VHEIPPLPSRPIGRIARAHKFSEYYLRLPGILNDPFCCMMLLAIECSGEPMRQRRCSEDCLCFWMARTTIENCPFPWEVGRSAPQSNSSFLGPTQVLVQNGISISRLCTAHRKVSHYFTMGHYVPPQKKKIKLPLLLGISGPSNTWSLQPTQVIISNGISNGLAIFVWVLMLCCTMHCQWGTNPQNCPFPLWFRHPAGGGPSHGDRQHA